MVNGVYLPHLNLKAFANKQSYMDSVNNWFFWLNLNNQFFNDNINSDAHEEEEESDYVVEGDQIMKQKKHSEVDESDYVIEGHQIKKQKLQLISNDDTPVVSTPQSEPFYDFSVTPFRYYQDSPQITTEITNSDSDKIEEFQAGLEGLIQTSTTSESIQVKNNNNR
jgi:hypothetical protein